MDKDNLVNSTIDLLKESRLNEWTEESRKDCKIITLTTRDPDKNLEKLLECIKSYSTMGHSFEVVVDPNDDERKQSFYIDGDGCDQLLEIKIKEPEKD